WAGLQNGARPRLAARARHLRRGVCASHEPGFPHLPCAERRCPRQLWAPGPVTAEPSAPACSDACDSSVRRGLNRGLPMKSAETMSASPVPSPAREPATLRARRLAAARRRATALLAAVTALFVGVTVI